MRLRTTWRQLPLALLLLIVFAAQVAAATKEYVAQAGARPQIDSITVSGTWAAGDTGTVTIGNSSVIVTCGSSTTTTAQMADVVKRAINATRIDENLVGDESRSAAGQQIGEFRDVEAVIDPTNTSRVLVRSVVAGVPFGTPGASGGPINAMTVADTAAAGALARASVQTATGPWHWDAAANWSTGSVPGNDDIVVFMGTKDGPKYGLPNSSLEVTFNVYKNFEGWVGLPLINTANGTPYTEYRQRFARLDDAGTGTDIAHRFGLGASGKGSPLINLRHTLVKCSPVVFSTGQPLSDGTYALNVVLTTNTSTLNVLDGSVDCSSADGQTAALATLTQNGGVTRGIAAMKTSGNVNLNGGQSLIGGTLAIATTQVRGGVLRIENQTGAVNILQIFKGGTVTYASNATIANLYVIGGTFDARDNTGSFTATTAELFQGGTFLDPYRRATFGGSGLAVGFEPSDKLQVGGSESEVIYITR